jgi:hypothetical protein
LLETGAATFSKNLNTSDAEMGEMMRMVIAHEVGHALGFPHIWVLVVPMILKIIEMVITQKNGIAASLMDYARFNYIAQPGDKNVLLSAKWTLRSLCYELGI